jgi:hypothetical protein
MFRILKFALIAFGIFCITGCPPPNRIYIITEKGEAWGMQVLDSGYKLDILDALPWYGKGRKKTIGFYGRLVNSTNDTLRLNCSAWFIGSKDDTLRLKEVYDSYGNFPIDTNYTVTFSPGCSHELYLNFAGSKTHSLRSYNQSLRKDTLFFQINLNDESIRVYPMRNHHRGPFIWSRRY